MISFDESKKLFVLQSQNSTYAMAVVETGELIHLHYGAKTECAADLPTPEELLTVTTLSVTELQDNREYVDWGLGSYLEPSIKCNFSDGTKDLWLKYKNHEILPSENGTQILLITLKDDIWPLEVVLSYRVIYDLDIVERSVTVVNTGKDNVKLDRVYSAGMVLPRKDTYRVTSFCGGWACEYQKKQQILEQGQLLLRSNSDWSGPEFAPFFMIDENAYATERSGAVYFGSVVWSGNWKVHIIKDCYNRTNVCGGLSDFDFEWILAPGESFETPVFVWGYTEGGFGDAGRKTVEYERQHIMSPVDASRVMPLVYNAYGTFFSQISEEKIMSIIDTAHDLGVELFVMDSGWTGTGDDTTFEYRHGFGDWTVNPDRFPKGLRAISDALHAKGMKYGIWMEPEAVHPKSNLIKEHPEWIHCNPSREPVESGFRYVFNFAIDEAAEYMTNKIIKLVEDYNLDYFKMDFCQTVQTMAYRTGIYNQKDIHVRHIQNLYKCYETLKKRFPDIIVENCASGGYRADMGMLRFSGRMNRSDNQDPYDILKIHEGYSYIMDPKLAGGGCHVSDIYTHHMNARTSPMKFQAYVAMMGSMAIGKNLNEITPEETQELKTYTKLYKEIRETVHLGDFYRIASPLEKTYAIFESVSKDKSKAVVFAFSQSMNFAKMPELICLDGLDPDAMYEVEGYGVRSGRGLMNIGIQIPLRGDMDCRIIKINKIN